MRFKTIKGFGIFWKREGVDAKAANIMGQVIKFRVKEFRGAPIEIGVGEASGVAVFYTRNQAYAYRKSTALAKLLIVRPVTLRVPKVK